MGVKGGPLSTSGWLVPGGSDSDPGPVWPFSVSAGCSGVNGSGEPGFSGWILKIRVTLRIGLGPGCCGGWVAALLLGAGEGT